MTRLPPRPRRRHHRLRALPPPPRPLPRDRPGPEARPRGRRLLGPAGPQLRRSRAPDCSIVGLAPAAHGANRTGQLFTGDVERELALRGAPPLRLVQPAQRALRATTAWCSPTAGSPPPPTAPRPATGPRATELARCRPVPRGRARAAASVRVVLALGRIGWERWLRAAGWWDRLPAAGAAGVRARGGDGDAGRDGAGDVVSPEPAEHEYGRLTREMWYGVFEADPGAAAAAFVTLSRLARPRLPADHPLHRPPRRNRRRRRLDLVDDRQLLDRDASTGTGC